MFQFRAFPAYHYLIHGTLTRYCRAGFPHSEISGSMRMCRSPKLIAACRVLLRLLMPRHSPCALISLIFSGSQNYAGHRSVIARIVVFVTLIPQYFCVLPDAPSVALLLIFLHCSVFKVQTAATCVPSKLNKVRFPERTDLRKSAGVVTRMSP